MNANETSEHQLHKCWPKFVDFPICHCSLCHIYSTISWLKQCAWTTSSRHVIHHSKSSSMMLDAELAAIQIYSHIVLLSRLSSHLRGGTDPTLPPKTLSAIDVSSSTQLSVLVANCCLKWCNLLILDSQTGQVITHTPCPTFLVSLCWPKPTWIPGSFRYLLGRLHSRVERQLNATLVKTTKSTMAAAASAVHNFPLKLATIGPLSSAVAAWEVARDALKIPVNKPRLSTSKAGCLSNHAKGALARTW